MKSRCQIFFVELAMADEIEKGNETATENYVNVTIGNTEIGDKLHASSLRTFTLFHLIIFLTRSFG
jgi:hypothetical protein